jgi:hypothetical protein
MAKFLTSYALNDALDKIFEEAREKLILVSPYIKLHDRTKATLLSHLDNPGIEIKVVFGKNDDDVSKSVSREDLDFFTQFLNVEIRHESRLHAKYYANELDALITSMNLYGYSQNQNIEAGILVKFTMLGILKGDSSLDADASDYFQKVINHAKLLYKRTPDFNKGFAGTGFNKTYLGSKVEVDLLDEYFNVSPSKAKPLGAPKAIIANRPEKPSGYCIRTGGSIPFNPKRPMSDDAYKSWSKFSNPDYAEKFCHFSGEASNGETTFNKPILRKNWSKAKDIHGL